MSITFEDRMTIFDLAYKAAIEYQFEKVEPFVIELAEYLAMAVSETERQTIKSCIVDGSLKAMAMRSDGSSLEETMSRVLTRVERMEDSVIFKAARRDLYS